MACFQSVLFRAIILALVTAVLFTGAVRAQGVAAPVVLRDAETEDILKEWAKPVILSAGLDPAAIRIILVQDKAVNAFVAGGPNIFIYTGLLLKAENPAEILGVIAHELGHISGGHLVRLRGASENASYESILGTALGIGAAILTGEGRIGAAVAAGSQATALNRLLAFSRVQESSADQAALTALDAACLSAGGLLSFMQKLEADEFLPAEQQTAWARTHPLARDRVEALRAGYERARCHGKPLPTEWQDQYERLRAKLLGFLSPERVAWDYRDTDKSIPADYARAVAAWRQNRVADALRLIDGLIVREPDNPFFLELKGQMLTDFGRVAESVPAYRRASELYPLSGLIRAAYAHSLIETAGQNIAQLDEAITQLERAARDDPRSARPWRLLATAWGRKGDEPMARLFLAEEALSGRRIDDARRHAEAALNGLPAGGTAQRRAQDILSFIEQADKKD